MSLKEKFGRLLEWRKEEEAGRLAKARAAARARELLDDPAFGLAVEQAHWEILEAWRGAATTEAREELHRRQGLLNDVVGRLAGLVAEAEMDKLLKEKTGNE